MKLMVAVICCLFAFRVVNIQMTSVKGGVFAKIDKKGIAI